MVHYDHLNMFWMLFQYTENQLQHTGMINMWDFEVWRSTNIIVIVCPSAMIISRDIHKLATWSAFYPIKMRLHTSRMFIVQMC